MTAASTQNLPWTRLLLVFSAGIALLSVGMTMFRAKESAAPVAAAGQQTAPDINEIIARLEDRLKQDPSSAEGWQWLGWSYTQAGRHDDAVRAYRRAVALEPGQADSWSSLGESLLSASRNGFPDEAKTAFDKALALDAGNVRARFFIGAAKEESGDANGAIADWTALLNDAPPDAPWAAAVRQKIGEVTAANDVDAPNGSSVQGEQKR